MASYKLTFFSIYNNIESFKCPHVRSNRLLSNQQVKFTQESKIIEHDKNVLKHLSGISEVIQHKVCVNTGPATCANIYVTDPSDKTLVKYLIAFIGLKSLSLIYYDVNRIQA